MAHCSEADAGSVFARVFEKGWTDHLDSRSNKKLYVLSLEPEVDVGNHVIGIDLVLRNAEEPNTDENLPSPWQLAWITAVQFHDSRPATRSGQVGNFNSSISCVLHSPVFERGVGRGPSTV